MSDDTVPLIKSPDTDRPERIPPGQVETRKWPVLHEGPTPSFDRVTWRFRIFGAVQQPVTFTYDQLLSLPRVLVFADMHCVTTWSKLNNTWEGVSTREILRSVELLPSASVILVRCSFGYTTNLSMSDFLAEDCLFAFKHNDEDLTPDHGYPLRLVIPRLYAWKSAKWVTGLEVLEKDRPGFWESWENGGYHLRGDPWTESRFREDRDSPGL